MEHKKHKVLIVITKSNWGGAQKYVFDLATNLSRDKFDVRVIFGGHGILAEKLEEAGITTISIPELGRDVSILKDIKVFFKLWSIFKKQKAEIVHVNSSKIGGIGALAGRLSGAKKIVFTAHGWAFNENRSSLSKNIIKFLY